MPVNITILRIWLRMKSIIIAFMSCNISTEKTWVDDSHLYYLNVEHHGLTVYSTSAPTFCQGFKKVGLVFISTTKGVYGDSISIFKAKNKLVLSIIGSKGEKYIDNIDGHELLHAKIYQDAFNLGWDGNINSFDEVFLFFSKKGVWRKCHGATA